MECQRPPIHSPIQQREQGRPEQPPLFSSNNEGTGGLPLGTGERVERLIYLLLLLKVDLIGTHL